VPAEASALTYRTIPKPGRRLGRCEP
jgi:hypothetical protein